MTHSADMYHCSNCSVDIPSHAAVKISGSMGAPPACPQCGNPLFHENQSYGSIPSLNKEIPTNLNPWFSIFIHPRLTMRHVQHENRYNEALMIAAIAGIPSLITNMMNQGNKVEDAPLLLLWGIALIAGPLVGIIGLYLGSWFTLLGTRMLGGQADGYSTRLAMGWCNVFDLWSILLIIPMLVVFGPDVLYMDQITNQEPNFLQGVVLLIFGMALITLGIWHFVALLHAIGEINHFSAWRSLGSMLLVGLIFGGAIIFLAIFVAFLI